MYMSSLCVKFGNISTIALCCTAMGLERRNNFVVAISNGPIVFPSLFSNIEIFTSM